MLSFVFVVPHLTFEVIFSYQAIRTKDFSFLQRILISTTSDLLTLSNGAANLITGDRDAIAVEEQTRWVLHFVDTLMAADSLRAGAHVGLVIAWLLDTLKFGEPKIIFLPKTCSTLLPPF